MTDQAPEQPLPFLTGEEALAWFLRRRGGGALFDEHMILIQAAFGDDVLVRPRAAVDPSSGQPTVLIIDISRSPDDDDSWRRLLEVQQRLIERENDLAGRLRLKAPYRNIVLNLSGEPQSWNNLLAELESEE